MNHIYKVVWSKVRGCYVVVAEIARSNGKTRSQKVVAVLGTALISSMLFTGGGLLTAEAAQGQAFGDSTTASGANSIAAGNTTTASGQESIALGTHNTASGKWSVAFGGTSIQQTFRNHGKNYFVYQIGDKTYYKNENDYFSTEDNMKFTGDASTATAVMVNAGNTASGDASVAFGQNTQAKSLGSVAFGMGTQAGAEDGKGGQNSIAFGNYTKALGGRSVAFGEYTIANYNDSVAFGNDTRALSTGATAFGNRTRALSSYSTAWGNATVAADEESTAWGSDTIAGAKLDDNGAVTNIYTYKNNPDDKNEQPKTATERWMSMAIWLIPRTAVQSVSGRWISAVIPKSTITWYWTAKTAIPMSVTIRAVSGESRLALMARRLLSTRQSAIMVKYTTITAKLEQSVPRLRQRSMEQKSPSRRTVC